MSRKEQNRKCSWRGLILGLGALCLCLGGEEVTALPSSTKDGFLFSLAGTLAPVVLCNSVRDEHVELPDAELCSRRVHLGQY